MRMDGVGDGITDTVGEAIGSDVSVSMSIFPRYTTSLIVYAPL